MDIAFRAILPVFLSTPIEIGGLGLNPSTIGTIFSVSGILSGVLRVFFFARINDYWGSRKIYMAGIVSVLGSFVCFPIMSLLAKNQGLSNAVWGLVAVQTVLSVGTSFSYGELRCESRYFFRKRNLRFS